VVRKAVAEYDASSGAGQKVMPVERCSLCQTELTISNTDSYGQHELSNCAQVLYAQRNEARDLVKSMSVAAVLDAIVPPTSAVQEEREETIDSEILARIFPATPDGSNSGL